MTAGTATAEELRAASLTEVHADTPAVTFLDSLGREVISIAHNRHQYPGDLNSSPDEKYLTFTKLDAEGKPLWIRDARKNLVTQYIRPPMPDNQSTDSTSGFVPCYDIAGNSLNQHSMDAGDRWTLNDAAGKSMYAWDFNERRNESGAAVDEHRVFFTSYDALHRPVEQRLTINGGTAQLIELFFYGEQISNQSNARSRNLRGQLHRHYDQSGLQVVEDYDFKGNPREDSAPIGEQLQGPGNRLGCKVSDSRPRIRNLHPDYGVRRPQSCDPPIQLASGHRQPGGRVRAPL